MPEKVVGRGEPTISEFDSSRNLGGFVIRAMSFLLKTSELIRLSDVKSKILKKALMRTWSARTILKVA